jgi:mannose-6-phosphate isomerase-like protein (cupin superfamily)
MSAADPKRDRSDASDYKEPMADYTLMRTPARIPVGGGKIIDELFGRVASGESDISIAHMVAPPGWSEPAQTPTFAEITIMVRGRLRAEVGGDVIELGAGDAIRVAPGVKVRYENPHGEESEYWAICLPAFSLEGANRDPEEG